MIFCSSVFPSAYSHQVPSKAQAKSASDSFQIPYWSAASTVSIGVSCSASTGGEPWPSLAITTKSRSAAGSDASAPQTCRGMSMPTRKSWPNANTTAFSPGGPYGEEVVLADVELEADLDDGVAHVVAGRRGLLLVFALGEHAAWRLLVTRPAGQDELPFGQPGPPISASDLQALLDDAGLNARITDLAWSARYQLQHRLATRFRQDRLFLAGDAAHAYSPATGQGMNTGIQDALNLGWKLAFAASATDGAALLDSYELERRPVVRRTLALTHLAFWAEASPDTLPSLLRGVVGPPSAPVVPALAGRRRLLGEVLSKVSQLRAAYRDSPLSLEGTPRLTAGPRTGHRLPDATVTADGHQVRLHTLLAQPGVHVLLHRDANQLELQDFGPHVTVHRLTSRSGTSLVAVRPDGYVGFRCGVADAAQLQGWLARIGAGAFAITGDSAQQGPPKSRAAHSGVSRRRSSDT
jgi:hypothetical protein